MHSNDAIPLPNIPLLAIPLPNIPLLAIPPPDIRLRVIPQPHESPTSAASAARLRFPGFTVAAYRLH